MAIFMTVSWTPSNDIATPIVTLMELNSLKSKNTGYEQHQWLKLRKWTGLFKYKGTCTDLDISVFDFGNWTVLYRIFVIRTAQVVKLWYFNSFSIILLCLSRAVSIAMHIKQSFIIININNTCLCKGTPLGGVHREFFFDASWEFGTFETRMPACPLSGLLEVVDETQHQQPKSLRVTMRVWISMQKILSKPWPTAPSAPCLSNNPEVSAALLLHSDDYAIPERGRCSIRP